MSDTSRVFLVDDQPGVLKALSRLLTRAGFDVVSFQSAPEFLDSGNADAPGCLVLDLAMPDMNGMELQQALVDRGSLLPIIFLTGEGNIDTCVRAMKVGAVDFLTKPFKPNQLLSTVTAAMLRNTQDRAHHDEQKEIWGRLNSLTPREREVLAMIVAGKLNKQIAAEMGTVEQTVKFHRAAIMAKMKAHSVAELVRLTAQAKHYP